MNGIYPSVTPSEIVLHYPQSYGKNMKNDVRQNKTRNVLFANRTSGILSDRKSSRANHEVVTTLGVQEYGIPFATFENIGSLTFSESIYLDVR